MCIICIDSIKIEKTGTIFENGAEFKIKHCVLCVYVQDNEIFFFACYHKMLFFSTVFINTWVEAKYDYEKSKGQRSR